MTEQNKMPESKCSTARKRLIAIVEGIEGAKHGTWRDDNGMRLKDTKEWIEFYITKPDITETPTSEELFPLLNSCKKIPWSIAEKIYDGYASKYRRSQSLKRIAERGGFHTDECDAFYPQWREDTDEIIMLRKALTAKEDGLSDEALKDAKGMVEFCINHGYCMGMDEGRNEKGEYHPFVKELLGWCDIDTQPPKQEGA
jgi:hypothetical protein